MIDLGRFDAIAFQDLAATLAVAHFGAGVRSMGAGRDGGRDLVCEHPLRWTTPGIDGYQDASGYTVFQVKHMEQPSTSHPANEAWLWGQVRDELRDWAEKLDRPRVPTTLIFVTNVALTPFPKSGGFDAILEKIRLYVERAHRRADEEINEGLRQKRRSEAARLSAINAIHFWDLHQINALVHAHADVRLAYNAFLTAGDVLSAIPTLLNLVTENNLEGALRAHARTTLTTGGRIYFDEAGAASDSGMPVHKVMVDLPVLVPAESSLSGARRTTVLPYVLERSSRVLKPSKSQVKKPRHVIITGAPGNGKSTLSKMIVQAHRAAFLREASALSDDQRTLIDETDDALTALGVAPPVYPRWPIQINLAEYGQDEAVDMGASLIRRIARDVSAKSDVGDISPSLLSRWRNKWPWLLVLDGFDELVDSTLRHRIIEQITEFTNDCEAEDADVLILLTTRPLGFTEEVGNGLFERINLTDLNPETALLYGEKVTAVRLANGPERRELVIRRLREAASDEAFENLLRTPLQVLILSIIVEQAGEVSPDRFSLFDGYFHTVLTREKGKIGGFSTLIRDHAALIEQIHHRVGVELQARAEQAETTRSVISPDELHDVVWTALKEEGFRPDNRDRQLLSDIKQAATHRLLLLAPHGEDGYGFDVRSLQEYMAGQYLATVSDTAVGMRLRLTAVSPHWRNTWLFAAGKMFVQPTRHLQALVVEIIETIDDDAPNRLGAIFPVGPQLALDVINDGMARARPIWLGRLINRALALLERPTADISELTTALVKFASTNDNTRELVSDGLRAGLASGRSRAGVKAVLAAWTATCDAVGASTRVRGISQIKPSSVRTAVVETAVMEQPESFSPNTSGFTPRELALLTKAINLATHPRPQMDGLTAALENNGVSQALEERLSPILSASRRAYLAVEREVESRVLRAPVGHTLLRDATPVG
jgi:energy-coupling factor transporter ATP-binding protein EcfA2